MTLATALGGDRLLAWPAMSSVPRRRPMGMSPHLIEQLDALEGRRVGLAVRGGDRIDDCRIVSAGRGRVRTLWVFVNGADTFVPVDDVVDVWEAA
ncbi:MAG: hypothetical protein ACRD07_13575 [Acidimicrobiales bacterium]